MNIIKDMKITICGSMAFAKQMQEYTKKLEKLGHVVYIPHGVEDCAKGRLTDGMGDSEAAKRKIENDLIRRHYDLIKKSDAILVLNHDKNGIQNYIGGNSFLELGFAHILGKKIYLINPIPGIKFFRSEIEAMRPVVLDGDVSLIR